MPEVLLATDSNDIGDNFKVLVNLSSKILSPNLVNELLPVTFKTDLKSIRDKLDSFIWCW